jgi:DNA-binding NtrC family response regulator
MDDGKCVTEVSVGPIIKSTDDTRISVLYVEEEHLVSKVTKELLELQGKFQVDTACSVEEAYDKLKLRKYDVIVSNYQMPEKDGLQFLKELKESGNSVPFILFTGKGREEVAVEALNLRADRALTYESSVNRTRNLNTRDFLYALLTKRVVIADFRRCSVD